MIRVNFHLTEKQIAKLKKHANETGLSVAEIIRRAVDAWLKKQERKNASA